MCGEGRAAYEEDWWLGSWKRGRKIIFPEINPEMLWSFSHIVLSRGTEGICQLRVLRM